MNKANSEDFIDRYKEIVSDPINLLIHRVKEAGCLNEDNTVTLHNGNKVPFSGQFSYYDDYSEILVINRGVHEPLEEFCFQEVLKQIKQESPVMIELGSYWAHYSMWFLQKFNNGVAYMVEPYINHLETGMNNFRINGYLGNFIYQDVAKFSFEVDKFIDENKIERLTILHCDIQGNEVSMLEVSEKSLRSHAIDYIFISTHSQKIHLDTVKILSDYGYRIEVSSDFDYHTTSYDGFILATSPKVNKVFNNFKPFGRVDILSLSPAQILESVSEYQKNINTY
jgi:hypothetical protein